MADRIGFQQKLADVVKLAGENGMTLSVEEVEKFFEEDRLSEEQMDLVFDYLLTQKVSLPGYTRRSGTARLVGEEDETERGSALNEEEKEYMAAYLAQIGDMQPSDENEARFAYYLPKVANEAVRMHRKEIFIADLIQEGNASLVEALKEYPAGSGQEDLVMEAVKASMQLVIASQEEVERRDRRMVEKVAALDETIQRMTDELGRKVDVSEVAGEMKLTEEQIRDILKLAGEEPEE